MTNRLSIRVAVQDAILEFQIKDCELKARNLKKNPRCLVDVITDAVYKVVKNA